MKILDYLFGNKIKLVTATCLKNYAEFECSFLFHKNSTRDEIKESLWNQIGYSVKNIESFRSKTIASPKVGRARPYTKERVIFFYD